MFRNTNLGFKLSYFITSMFPSIILFTLKNLLENADFGVEYRVLIALSIVVIITISGIIMINNLKKNYFNEKYYSQDKYQQDDFSLENVAEFNGNPVSFIISNVSSIFIINEYFAMSVICYVLLMSGLYIMMMNAKNIQPNLFLMIAKIDVIKTKNNDFLLVLNDTNNSHNNILKFTKGNENSLHIVGKLEN